MSYLRRVADFRQLVDFCDTLYSCNMGTGDLPGIYAQSLRVQPEDYGHTFQSNRCCP